MVFSSRLPAAVKSCWLCRAQGSGAYFLTSLAFNFQEWTANVQSPVSRTQAKWSRILCHKVMDCLWVFEIWRLKAVHMRSRVLMDILVNKNPLLGVPGNFESGEMPIHFHCWQCWPVRFWKFWSFPSLRFQASIMFIITVITFVTSSGPFFPTLINLTRISFWEKCFAILEQDRYGIRSYLEIKPMLQ